MQIGRLSALNTYLWWLLPVVMVSHNALADQYHYNNLLIGDRAIGLGGAYGGVSDDASGVYYNPAGLAFAISNDVSGSANAMNKKTITYKKTVGGEDFIERSGGTFPSFFGGLQKLDHVAKGLVFAFGVYTTDGELKDQDDLISNKILGTPSPCAVLDDAGEKQKDEKGVVITGEDRPSTVLDRFHRTVNQKASSSYAGAAVAYRIANTVSVGFGVNYVTAEELVQEYQDVRTQISQCKKDGTFSKLTEQKAQNIRQYIVGYGIQPTWGIQTAITGKLSLGLTVKTGAYVSQKFTQGVEARNVAPETTDQDKIDASSTPVPISGALVSQVEGVTTSTGPLGKIPTETRLGIAYFYSTRLLLALDFTQYGAVSDAADITGVGKLYSKEAIMNYATGMEFYVTPSFPLRLGLFTNKDARPEVEKNKTGQRDHVDYTGGSLFLAYVQPNSQISTGLVLQQGDGKAQKIGGSKVIQKVEASSYTFAFSAIHSF